jgi:hypothetical protein
MQSKVGKMETTPNCPITTPKYIEDNFILGNRIYNKLSSGPTVYFVVDNKKNICETVRIKEDKESGDRSEGSKTKVAYFSISRLVEYPPIPELNSSSMFSFIITGIDGKPTKIKPASLDEIVGDLKSRGVFQQNNRAMDVVTNAIKDLQINKQYQTQNISPYPGFFILNDKLVATEKYNKPNKGQLADALGVLNEFGDHYGEFGPKLGYILHWMAIAPYSFVIKQKGLANKLNNLLLYGTTRTGKSTIAKLSCFIWVRDMNQHLYSGSHVHSTYQYAKAISQSTFPITVDEGEEIFNRPELASLLKTATHSLSGRTRYNSVSKKDEEFMALSPSIITSNYSKPNDGAVGARIDLLKYTSSEIRSKEERKEFTNRFQPEVQNGPLKDLQYIGNYITTKITENPELLNEDWLEFSKTLWQEMYKFADIEMPLWMTNFALPESVEESIEDEVNYYESNIKALILRNAKVQEYDDRTRIHHISNNDKIIDVVKMSREPWIYYHNPFTGPDANKYFVFIDKAIETDLKKEKGIDIRLDRIAELLGGKIQRKTLNNRKIKVAVFDYTKFIDLF